MKFSFALVASLVTAVQSTDPEPIGNPIPSQIGVTLDGDVSDWNTDSDGSIPLSPAGQAYLRSDCSSKTLCMLVLGESSTAFSYKDFGISDNPQAGTVQTVPNGVEACFKTSMTNQRAIEIQLGSLSTAEGATIDLSCDNDFEAEFEEEIESRTAGVEDPCAEEESTCIKGGEDCTHDPGACCSDLECTGYNFFKTCKETPVCLPAWHDCSIGIDCCDDMVCAVAANGLLECQTEKIGTRSVDITGGLIDFEEEEEVEEKDPRTSEVVSSNLVGACISGDPHIKTFDDVTYDCQGIGEFILMKSQNTGRQIQSRFKQVNDRAVSVQRGIVIQDEGVVPKIQIHVREGDGPAEAFGEANCALQFHVDNKQMSLFDGSFQSDDIELKTTDTKISFLFKASKMEVDISIRGGERCAVGACVYYPENKDTMVGLMGTPNDDDADDWMDSSGAVVTTKKARRGEVPYEYCTTNWCLKEGESAKSLFKYNEDGFDYTYFENCDFPEGSMMEDEIEGSLTAAQVKECAGNIMCMEEMIGVGEKGARGTKLDMEGRTKKLQKKVKNGRSCDKDSDCQSGNCFKNGWAGETCQPTDFDVLKDMNPMTKKNGLCNDKTDGEALPCGEGLECQMKNDEWGRCHKAGSCGKRNTLCATDDDCCGACMETTMEDGTIVKRCKKVKKTNDGVRLDIGEDCQKKKGLKCVDGAYCEDLGEDVFKCVEMPAEWEVKNRRCGEGMPGCSAAAGLTCAKKPKKGNNKKSPSKKEFNFLCKQMPTCAKNSGRCQLDDGTELPCCNEKKECLPNRNGVKVCKNKPKEKKTKTVTTRTFKMFEAGDSNSAVKAKARATVACDTKTLCVKVQGQKNVLITEDEAANWFKDLSIGTPAVEPLTGKLNYIQKNGKITGWKACYDISGLSKSSKVQFSANYGSAEPAASKLVQLTYCD